MSSTRAKPKTQRRPPRRRQTEILEAAARVFRERGYDSTSIQDIANEVGILKGSLYYYIESKEDLLYEILSSVHEEAVQNIERTEAVEGDALTKIRAFVTMHLMFNANNLIKMGIFFHDFRSLSPERREIIVHARDRYDRFLRDLIHAGQTEKVVCGDIDATLMAMAILGMTNWIYTWYSPNGASSPRQVAEGFADMVVAGLACTPKTHVPGHRSKVATWDPVEASS